MNPISSLFAGTDIVGKYINLNDESEDMFFLRDEEKSALLDARFCEAWIKYLHRQKKISFSYGGYMENRSHIWAGSYLEENEKYIHLGVDVNYGRGCVVQCPIDFKVIEKFQDTDQNGGWGLRVLVETKNGLVIFAHLSEVKEEHDMGVINVGESYREGTVVGTIASCISNGGWYPHLHLQGIRDISQMKDLDGYSKFRHNLRKDFPNPLKILEIK